MRSIVTKLVVSVLIMSGTLFAQSPQAFSDVAVKVRLNETNHIKGIEFKKDARIDKASFFNVYKNGMGLSDEDVMIEKRVDKDKLGYSHVRYKQFHKGLEVLGSDYILHEKNGRLESANGMIAHKLEVDVSPVLSESDAFDVALRAVSGDVYKWEVDNTFKKPEGKLAIVSKDYLMTEGSFRTVYRFDVYSEQPLARYYVDIDAKTGNVINKINRIHSANVNANGNTLYNGNKSFTADSFSGSYRLRQTSLGNGIQTFDMNNGTNYGSATDVTSSSTSFGNTDKTAVQAHWGAEQTYKYFKNTHNRNSYDNAGAIIKSYVHYSSNYVNAFWDGQRMTYGDGDGSSYGPLTEIDICGHEIAHAVTTNSADLVYSYESGALNESFSDIFGEMVEYYATGTNDWLMGDKMHYSGNGIRNMQNPNEDGDPDTYKGTNWHTSSSDNGGVHVNSGVQNFWFYLLSMGGSGTNDHGTNYNVTAIGRSKAEKIAYRNLTVYLTTNSNYSDAYIGSRKAAADLYGSGSTEYNAVTAAWAAVGVDDSNAGGGSNPGGGGGGGCLIGFDQLVSSQLAAAIDISPSSEGIEIGNEIYSSFTSEMDDVLAILGKKPELQKEVFDLLMKHNAFVSGEVTLDKASVNAFAKIVDRVRYESKDVKTRAFLNTISATISQSEDLTYSEMMDQIAIGLDQAGSEIGTEIPSEYALNGNYPNPFNPVTNISFNLPERAHVKITVYNVVGQVVKVLQNGYMNAGKASVVWNANNVASGVYIYRMETPHFTQSRKMVLLK